ncbi:MAG: hypothetical protein HY796_01530 [Elusimicrobia bacterium]|nr:hypothetical protein [Elusimicrobiota bacterium]
MKRVMLVVAILTSFSIGTYAQKYNPNFDQGPNLTEFLKAAQEMDSTQLYVPLSRIDGSVVKNSVLSTGGMGGNKGR